MIQPPRPSDNKLKIHHHDVMLHEHQSLENNGALSPFLWSIVIHVSIAGFFIIANLIPDISQPTIVETTLISSDELTSIKSQILANRSQAIKNDINTIGDTAQNTKAVSASNANTAKHNSMSVDVSSEGGKIKQHSPTESTQETRQKVAVDLPDDNTNFKKSPETIALEKKYAENQRKYNNALQQFEKDSEKEAQDKLQALADDKAKKQQEEREIINVFKKSEKDSPKKEERNKRILEEAKAKQEANRRQKEIKNTKTDSRSLSRNGEPNVTSKQAKASLSGNKNENASRGADKTQTNNIGAAINKIKAKFNPPTQSGNDKTSLIIHLSPTGAVLDIETVGTNAALNEAAKQAAYLASPLPIKKGDQDYPDFKLTLHGRGHK